MALEHDDDNTTTIKSLTLNNMRSVNGYCTYKCANRVVLMGRADIARKWHRFWMKVRRLDHLPILVQYLKFSTCRWYEPWWRFYMLWIKRRFILHEWPFSCMGNWPHFNIFGCVKLQGGSVNNTLREFLLDAVQNRVNSLLGSLFMSIRKIFGDNSC